MGRRSIAVIENPVMSVLGFLFTRWWYPNGDPEGGIEMTEPVRRGRGAAGSIIGTIKSVLTLPFRVLGQLFGGRRPRP